jgi:hypothetical protein
MKIYDIKIQDDTPQSVTIDSSNVKEQSDFRQLTSPSK